MKHVKHGKKLISLLLSAAVAMSMTLSSVSDLRQKLQELQSEQEKVNQQLKDAQSNKADAEALKTQLEQQKALILSQISNLSEQIGSLDEEIVNKQDEIDQKQQEVDQKQAEYDQRWADFKDRMRAMQRLNDGGSIALLSSATNLYQLLTFATTLDQIVNKDEDTCQQLENEHAELEQQRAELEQAKADLEATQADLETQKTALDGIDLELDFGRIVGLLGPNGSGKTTLIKLANGLLQPSAGSIRIAGMTPGPDTKAIVSYLPDADWLPDWMQVEQLVGMFTDFYADFDPAKAFEMLDALHIARTAKLRTLSKGNKEKVQLILAMSRAARLYLLDEPIGGVDPAARDYILNTIISNYSKDATVVISTHLIEDIEPVLDEAIFLKEGKIFAHRTVDEIRETEGMSVDEYFREGFKC